MNHLFGAIHSGKITVQNCHGFLRDTAIRSQASERAKLAVLSEATLANRGRVCVCGYGRGRTELSPERLTLLTSWKTIPRNR